MPQDVNLDELHREINRADFLMALYRNAKTDDVSRRLGVLLGDQLRLVSRLVAGLRVGGPFTDHLPTFRPAAQQPQVTATQSIPGDPS
jgi:hypothetical protein